MCSPRGCERIILQCVSFTSCDLFLTSVFKKKNLSWQFFFPCYVLDQIVCYEDSFKVFMTTQGLVMHISCILLPYCRITHCSTLVEIYVQLFTIDQAKLLCSLTGVTGDLSLLFTQQAELHSHYECGHQVTRQLVKWTHMKSPLFICIEVNKKEPAVQLLLYAGLYLNYR